MFARLCFYPTLGYGVAMSRISGRHWYDRLDETVIIGALPLKGVAEKLIKEENIKAVLSVTENYELKHLTFSKEQWAERGVEQLRLSAVDLTGTVPQDKLLRGVDFLQLHRAQGHSVYVHCKAGRTRSATVAICYLMQAHGLTPDKSYDKLKSCRPYIWLRDKQWNSIRLFFKEMNNKSQSLSKSH